VFIVAKSGKTALKRQTIPGGSKKYFISFCIFSKIKAPKMKPNTFKIGSKNMQKDSRKHEKREVKTHFLKKSVLFVWEGCKFHVQKHIWIHGTPQNVR